MPIDIDSHLVETATKITITRNEFNDKVFSQSTSSSPCLFVDRSSRAEASNVESTTVEGHLLFGAGENVAKGDVYYHPDQGYLEIIGLAPAKRLLVDASVQFKRCQVKRIRQIS